MKYRVFWNPVAEQQLEEIASQAEDPEEIASLAEAIDGWLLKEPNSFGESRDAGMRIAFAKPLAVLFEVLDDVQTVLVMEVWRTDLKSR